MNFPIGQIWQVAHPGWKYSFYRRMNRSISGKLPISCPLKTMPICPPASFIDLTANGKIVEIWHLPDFMTMLKQIREVPGNIMAQSLSK